jgi:uncharacterized protein (DUF2336 family)
VSTGGSLIDEVETAFRNGTSESRSRTLRRITDLFLDGVDGYKEQEIGVFDDVLCTLVDKIERETLTELSSRVAPSNKAPPRLCAQLSRHDDIAVARPVLSRSPLLSDSHLVEIAQSKSQLHLEAIASRPRLSERVSDALIDHGNNIVLTTVAGNFGARLSTRGYRKLLNKAETDEALAAAISSRPDLSPEMFRRLVAQAVSSVQQRLMATTNPALKGELQGILQDVSSGIARSADRKADIRQLPHAVQIDKSKLRSELVNYVESGRLTETVVALAALTGLAADTIRQLLSQEDPEAMLIACKACGLGWTTVRGLLELSGKSRGRTKANPAIYLDQYTKISRDTAERVMRFLKVRKTASAAEMKQMLAS